MIAMHGQTPITACAMLSTLAGFSTLAALGVGGVTTRSENNKLPALVRKYKDMTIRIDPFITHCLAMMVGIAAYFTAPIDPPSLLLPLPANPVAAALALAIACGGLLVIYLYVWAHRHLHIGHPLALRGLLLLIAVFFGFIYAHGMTLLQARAMAPLPAQVSSMDAAPTLFQGRIIWAEPRPNGGLVDLAIADTAGRQVVLRLYTGRARIARLRPGCLATLSAAVRPLQGPVIRGGYDPRFAGFFNGRAGQGFIREIGQVDCAAPLSIAEKWRMGLANFRLQLAAHLRDAMPTAQGSVAAALVTGVRGAIPKSTRTLFRDSGLAHMLAISGLHMALFAGSVYALLRLLGACFPYFVQAHNMRKMAALASLPAAFAYLQISGASFPTQRAFIMLALFFVAILLGRPALTMRNVALAALLVLLISPHALMQAGFQMSFAAVFALVALYERGGANFLFATPDQRGQMPRNTGFAADILSRMGRYFIALFVTSIIAGSVTGFLALYHFHQVAAYGLFANMLAMPIFGFVIMPAGFLALVSMPFGLEAPFMALMSFGIKSVLTVAEWLTGWPGAVFYRGQSAPAILPLALGGLALACLANGRWRYGGFAFIGLALMLAGRAERPIVYIYGVGQAVMYESRYGGLHILRGSRRAYEIGLWQRTHGLGGDDAPIEEAPCSESVCFYPLMDGRQFAYVRAGRGLSQACRQADLVLAPFIEARYPCRAFLVDRRHLTKGKAVTVMAAQSAYEIVEPARAGRRLWQSYYRPQPDAR
ncbi:MAG: ComEC/Rec2 family competence protein [Parvibaculales bacterium]